MSDEKIITENEPRTIRKEKTKLEINKKTTTIMAVILWLLSVFTVETFIKAGFGMTTPILTGIYIIFLFWYYKNEKITYKTILVAILTFILSLSLVVTYSITPYLLTCLLLIYLVPTLAVSISGYSTGNLFSIGKLASIAVGALGKTFNFLDVPWEIASKSNKSKGFKIAAGLIIAMPIVALFIYLFNSADAIFKFSLNSFMDNINIDPGSIFTDIFFGTILSIFMIAMHFGFKIEDKRIEKTGYHGDIFDNTIVITFFSVLVPIYLFFIFIQIKYLFTTGSALPGGISYSEYAVSGFYQLCSIVFISSLMIIIALTLTKRNEKGYSIPLKVILSSLIIGNFVIVASAFFRMFKYIGAYDLSVKRVIVSWLILLIVFLLIGLLIRIWQSGFNILSYIGVIAVVMISILNFSNVNRIVAEYNVNQYIESKYNKELDINYLAQLGPGATPATARLIDTGAPDRKLYLSAMTQQKYLAEKKDWRNITIDNIFSRSIFKKYSIKGYNTKIENSEAEKFPFYNNRFDDFGYNSDGLDVNGNNRNK